jgi:hypothetical protein
MSIAGLSGSDALLLEHKLQIAHGGGVANLDCVLTGSGILVGVESKLTETLARHDPVEWRAPYRSTQMSALLTDGWRDALKASRAREWTPRYLGLEQLIKHALALVSHADGRTTHLVYCYWEPANGLDIPEVVEHRNEVADLRSRVGSAAPHLHCLTYAELLLEWLALPARSWIPEHVRELRDRYELRI